jgi:predicted ATP-grasp superfamily ATP-dependent carboligase
MDLVRPLGLAGIRCAVAARPGAMPSRSRFVRDRFEWVDPAADPVGFVDAVIEFARRQAEPPVLFCEGDWDLLALSRHRDRLDGAVRFLLPDADLVEDLMDKERFQALAARLDLPVPPAVRADPATVAAHELPLPPPLIVKPLTRNSATWDAVAGGAKALEVDSCAELQALWPRLAEAGIDVLLQAMVPGSECCLESYHVYVDADGEIAGEFTGRKIRTHPEHFGHSSAVEITRSADVRELGREVTRRLDMRGVAKLDFKRAADGELRLLEVNPRFNLWHHAGAVAGVNLPAIAYADLAGWPRPPAGEARAGVRWVHPVLDFNARRADGVGLGEWLVWLARTDARSGLSGDDPMPLIARVLASGRRWG